jgi:hypothetical protein
LAGDSEVTVGAAAEEPELHPPANAPIRAAAKYAKYREGLANLFIGVLGSTTVPGKHSCNRRTG